MNQLTNVGHTWQDALKMVHGAQRTVGEVDPPERLEGFHRAWVNLIEGVWNVIETGDRNPYVEFDHFDPVWSSPEMAALHQAFEDATDEIDIESHHWLRRHGCDWIGFDWTQ